MPYRTSKETQQKKDEKKQHILDCATHVFAAKGYNDTSVRDIVEAADISTGSFYFYFKNKRELFEALRQEAITMLMGVISTSIQEEGPFYARLGRTIARCLRAIEWHAEKAYLMMVVAMEVDPLSGNAVRDTVGIFVEYIEALYTQMHEEGNIQIPETRIAAGATAGMVYYLVMDWLQEKQKRPLTADAHALTVFTLNALRAEYNEEDVRDCIQKALNEN